MPTATSAQLKDAGGVDMRAHVDMQTAPACHAEELWATFEHSTGLNLADAAHSGYVELSYKELLEEAHELLP